MTVNAGFGRPHRIRLTLDQLLLLYSTNANTVCGISSHPQTVFCFSALSFSESKQASKRSGKDLGDSAVQFYEFALLLMGKQ